MTKNLGTKGFIAPEIALGCKDDGKVYDARADVWSAGALLFMMLFGYCPYFQDLAPMQILFVFNHNLMLSNDLFQCFDNQSNLFKMFYKIVLQALEIDHNKRKTAKLILE